MGENVTTYAIRGRAAWITLNAPESRNALSAQMVQELGGHLRVASNDPAVRVIVLTGNGPAFCAGADLKGGANAAGSSEGAQNPSLDVIRLIWDGPKPVIAAINGHAFGGGIGLVAAADIAIAAEGARFAFSEVRVGVIPAMISVVVLPKLGLQQTTRLFLTGARFGAADALRYQLVHRVVPADELGAAVQEEIDQLLLGGPIAVGEAKQLIRNVSRLPLDEAFRYAEDKVAALFASPEAAEGMAAFLEKRRPKWTE
ncbi:MAG: enoyl-CoA hydratase-related protein [Deltaproteobacteria bacterium]|nr:enoyl-CoA hydratase-related protein [Deltaproteobacteria bacterium]